MGQTVFVQVERYRVPLDRSYHPQDHTWVRSEGEFLRVGMDELGQEITGDLAQLFLVPPGTEVKQGDELGSIEAQKFVGPLRAPVCGTVAEINMKVVEDPTLVAKDPYGDGWLVLLRPTTHVEEDLAELVSEDKIHDWFAAEVDRFAAEGSVAE